MRVPGDLGFRGVSVIFFFVFISISSFVIRRKWRNSVERKREILRLVAMASEEAARAELEAAQEYGTVTVVRQSQCVVCYCPTTTRCSRCKAVRYCSGKCQIIHWRQGHKEECNPPSNNFQFDGPGSDFDRNSACQEPNVSGSTLENDGKVAPSTDVEETYMRSESTSVSSLADFSINTGSESMAGVSISKVPYSSYADRPDGPASDSISREVQYTTDHVKEPEVSPSQPFRSDSSVNDFFCSSTVKQTSFTSTVGVVNTASSKPSTTHSDFWEGTFDSNGYGNDNCDDSTSSSLSEGGDGTLLGSKPSSRFLPSQDLRAISNSRSPSSKVEGHLPSDGNCTNLGNNSSYHGASQSQRITRDTPRLNRSATSSSRRSESLDGVTSDSHLLEPKEKRSLSSTSDNKPPYTSRDHLFSSMRSSVADSVKRVPAGSSEVSYSLLNASKGLKTSARKVAHQFKVYKHSKYNSAGTASESTEKCSYKMLFPYELFVKLYHWNKLELRPCGFTNCGNSCYANAVLQCLAFTRPLTAYLLQGLHSKACRKKDWCFTCEFESLILKAKEGKSPLSPIGILSQLQSIGSHLNHGREEDAHDFLRNAIDTMQSVCLSEAEGDVERPLAEETSLIGLVFGGYLRSKIKCMKCSGKSERQERMMDLTVEIQGDIGTLEEALKKFTATEILDGENKYYCSRCKSYEKAKKKLTVLEAPNVLTIALKRFQSGNFGKLNKAVQFPEILDLAPYMSETNDKSPIYRLYAVVVHLDIMNAAFSGHYVCYVSNMQGKWFMIDDSTVKPVELERVLSKGAYMLFYSRCSPRAPSLIRNTLLSEETKANGYSEATPSAHRSRFSSTIPRAGSYLDSPVTYESFESYDRSFHPLHRIPKVDSASDNSSLLSNSDEGSCSTESTRDSIDDCSEYLFGESGRNCEGSSFSCYSGDIVVEADRVCSSRPFLHPDTNIQCRNLTKSSSSSGYGRSSSSSSSRETDLERLGWCYPLEGKNGVSQRKSIRDRSTKTLY